MGHIPGEDAPAVAGAAHAVVQEAVNAGVYVSAGGLESQPASIVATAGAVTHRLSRWSTRIRSPPIRSTRPTQASSGKSRPGACPASSAEPRKRCRRTS